MKKKSKLKGKITKYILLGIIGIFLLTGLNNCAKDMAEIKREKAGEFIDMDNAVWFLCFYKAIQTEFLVDYSMILAEIFKQLKS